MFVGHTAASLSSAQSGLIRASRSSPPAVTGLGVVDITNNRRGLTRPAGPRPDCQPYPPSTLNVPATALWRWRLFPKLGGQIHARILPEYFRGVGLEFSQSFEINNALETNEFLGGGFVEFQDPS
jgi:hypothetical protein